MFNENQKNTKVFSHCCTRIPAFPSIQDVHCQHKECLYEALQNTSINVLQCPRWRTRSFLLLYEANSGIQDHMCFIRRTEASQGQLNTAPSENNPKKRCRVLPISQPGPSKMPKMATSYFITKSLSVVEMLKLRKTIEKTSISIHLENFDMEKTVWSYSWSSEAIHNQPPAQGFSASRNSIWLETYLFDMHPCQCHGRVCAQQAYGPNWKNLIHANTQGRSTPPRTPWFISYRWFTKQLIVEIVGLECSLWITQRVLTWLTIKYFSGSWHLSI